MNCFECPKALFLKDANDGLCLTSVYCVINGSIVDVADVRCDSEVK